MYKVSSLSVQNDDFHCSLRKSETIQKALEYKMQAKIFQCLFEYMYKVCIMVHLFIQNGGFRRILRKKYIMWYTNLNNSSKVIKSIIYVFCNFQIERERKKEREREKYAHLTLK